LPIGRINLSGTLRLPSGVWLIGQGSGTSLYNTNPDQNGTAVLLVSGAAAGYNVGAGIRNLGIYTDNSAGIRGDASLTNGLYDFFVSNVQISAGGRGIDLEPVKAYHTRIDNIAFYNPGSTCIWIGDQYGYSAENVVSQVQVPPFVRDNYRHDLAQ